MLSHVEDIDSGSVTVGKPWSAAIRNVSSQLQAHLFRTVAINIPSIFQVIDDDRLVGPFGRGQEHGKQKRRGHSGKKKMSGGLHGKTV